METLKILSTLGVGLISGGVVGALVGRMTKAKEKVVELTAYQKAEAVRNDPELGLILNQNLKLAGYVAKHSESVKFHHGWNNGDGYFNDLIRHKFVGVAKGAMLHSVCPITGRLIIIFNKAAADGSNVIIFRRYFDVYNRYWRISGDYKSVDCLKDLGAGVDFDDFTVDSAHLVIVKYVKSLQSAE